MLWDRSGPALSRRGKSSTASNARLRDPNWLLPSGDTSSAADGGRDDGLLPNRVGIEH
jgi:hypothetical protein